MVTPGVNLELSKGVVKILLLNIAPRKYYLYFMPGWMDPEQTIVSLSCVLIQ